jgi:adenine-specific DNA-methyltransferase
MPTLNWIGKDKVVNHHQDIPFKVLEHKYGFTAEKGEQSEQTNSGNKIIQGDNLEALKSLMPEYEGRIKCIYIDPPYNTGNEKWVYNDNVNHPKIKKWLGEVVGKDGEDLTRHDKWLCMMYPRLKLLHKLLADDGAIFISIDDNEQNNLKLILDQIFGLRNFTSNIIWKKKTGASDANDIAIITEYILCYTKNPKYRSIIFSKNSDSYDLKRYKYFDDNYPERGPYYIDNLDRGGLQYSDSMNFPIECPDGSVTYPNGRNKFVNDGWTWKWGTKQVKWGFENSFLEVRESKNKKTGWSVYYRNYLNVDNRNQLIERAAPKKNLINDVLNADAASNIKSIFGKNVFKYSKPVKLIETIINFIKTDKDAIILDSFAGSGTTAHAVINLNKRDKGNRKFLLVEMEEYSNTITAERIKKLITGYKFNGKIKEIHKEYKINITNLKKATSIIDEVNTLKESNDYTKISIVENNGRIAIETEKTISGKTEGTGGEFDYYELGQPIFKPEKNLNEEVGEDKIREYIYYTETKQYLSRKREEKHKYLLDVFNETGYYFYYEKDKLTSLDIETLNIVTEKSEQYIIYADHCLLDQDYMLVNNIIFKKIPRDIKRF